MAWLHAKKGAMSASQIALLISPHLPRTTVRDWLMDKNMPSRWIRDLICQRLDNKKLPPTTLLSGSMSIELSRGHTVTATKQAGDEEWLVSVNRGLQTEVVGLFPFADAVRYLNQTKIDNERNKSHYALPDRTKYSGGKPEAIPPEENQSEKGE